MIRHVLGGVLAIVLVPSGVLAQTTLTIEAVSIDVHESAKLAAPVIGHVPRGRVLQVTREDGDWAMVVWPEAAAGVGYVRLKIGSLGSTETNAETSVSDVRADVEAVERAIWAIWESATALDEPSR
jgi:hypothetical protein